MRDGYLQYDDEPARHPANERHREEVGPQGAALILELRRLRQAFEHDSAHDLNAHDLNANDLRAKPSRRPPRERARSADPKRRRPQKGGMGRVIEACLEPFRSGPVEPIGRRSEPAPPPNVAPPVTTVPAAPFPIPPPS